MIRAQRNAAKPIRVKPYPPPALGKYQLMSKIGEGAYGYVFKGCERNDPTQLVALKKVINVEPRRVVMREVDILQKLHHPNIVRFIEKREEDIDMHIVMEFCEFDLCSLLEDKYLCFSMAEIKTMVMHLLRAVRYMHRNNVIHRDLKPQNILLNKRGDLKVADFGMARFLRDATTSVQRNTLTTEVVTLWYRSIELLLGAKRYDFSLDIWSVGCILMQLWTRCQLMAAATEKDQIYRIIEMCGSLVPADWPELLHLPNYVNIAWPANKPRRVVQMMKRYVPDETVCDFVDQFLVLNPKKRITAPMAFEHEFFCVEPIPCSLQPLMAKAIRNRLDAMTSRAIRKEAQEQHFLDGICVTRVY